MKDKTLPQFLLSTAKSNPHQTSIKFKSNSRWKSLSWKDHFATCEKIGSCLLSLGLKQEDRVGILSKTRAEWEFVDLATLAIGGVTVPIYHSYLPEELEYIVNDARIKYLVCEDEVQLKKWKKVSGNCPSVEKVILIENECYSDNCLSWEELNTQGSNYLQDNKDHFKSSCENIRIEQIATIIYTSGTTGDPKGVVLTQRQIMSELIDLFSNVDVNQSDFTLTFLPFAHIVGRVEMWGHIYKGYSLGYAESIEKIKKNLLEIRPTIMIAVPRIFEKIYNGILAQVETNPTKEKIFKWALEVGSEVSQYKMNKQAIPLVTLIQYQAAQKLVFNKIMDKLGGRLRFAISGGAPLNKKIAEFFHATGLLLLEGYGLSETTAAICVNTPLEYCFGTVGKPMGDVDIKIAEDGEILVKSDKVMIEYYNKPKETQKVFTTDGYFHTGDIGNFTAKGFLKITDRKKDLIKTAGGKYVAPQKLENLLRLSPYISNALIHGDQRKYIVALITLDEPAIKEFAKNKEISFSDFSSLPRHEKIKTLIRGVIAEANSHLASFETIKNFDILDKDFTIESGELTPSLKVKRKLCDERYKDKIDNLYGVDRSAF